MRNPPLIVLLVVLLLLVIGALPAWPYSTGWGYDPSGGLGLLLLILLVVRIARANIGGSTEGISAELG